MTNRWNSIRSISGAGVLIDNGCHAFDLITFLFGGIRAVKARLGEASQGLDVEETASIEVVVAGGVSGTVELSWSKPPRGDEYLQIYGESGDLHIGWQRSRLERSGGETLCLGQPYDKARVHRQMMERFCRVIRGLERPWIGPAESLLVAEAIEAACRSCVSENQEKVVQPQLGAALV